MSTSSDGFPVSGTTSGTPGIPGEDDCPPPLARYGWDTHAAEAFAPYARGGEAVVPARLLRVDRGSCEAVTPRGPVRAATGSPATAGAGHDPAHAPCTGDWAVLARDAAGASGGEWSVRALLPRRTAFVRSAPGRRSDGQVLAANVDLAVVAVSLDRDLDLGRVERFVSLAWSSGAEPLLALTKADLVPDPAPLLAGARSAAPGVTVLAVSAETGAGLAELAAGLAGRTSVLIGQSGAGKSTLVNALLGAEVQRVGPVRGADGKGRHTTTARELLALPGGGVLIDTPGLRGVGLWDAEDGVQQTFADIEQLADECRFSDCAHRTEPGCAVLAAIEDGTLPERRLASYRKLLREQRVIAARTDARLRAEIRQEWKKIQAHGRQEMERKRGGRHRP